MPEELIMNEPDKLIGHLKSKGRLIDLEYQNYVIKPNLIISLNQVLLFYKLYP